MTDTPTTDILFNDRPQMQRLRHEIVRRDLTVRDAERLTPHMIRLTLTGPSLDGFASPGFDDHVKLFLPGVGAEPVSREYTPRRFDADRGELVIDLVDHAGGPATDWARAARPGDGIVVAGPRGSVVIGGTIDRWVMIGDETALPAIARQVEELPPGTPVTTLIAVPGADDHQPLPGAEARWLHRPAADAADPEPFLDALPTLAIPPRSFIWVAAESGVARAIRAALLERGVPQPWIKAAGYWTKGRADTSDKAIGEG